MPPRPHRTVERISQILEEVASSRRGCTLAELAKKLEAPKSSVQGFVNGLVEVGYVSEQNRRYFLGPAPFMLTQRAHRVPLGAVRHEDLLDLSAETECSVLLGILVGRDLVYIDHVGVGTAETYMARTRPRRPTLRVAAGRLLVALMAPAEMYDFLDREDPDLVNDFLSHVDRIRAERVSVSERSIAPQISAIAIPVTDSSDTAFAALVIAGEPDDVLPRRDELVPLMRKHADSWARR